MDPTPPFPFEVRRFGSVRYPRGGTFQRDRQGWLQWVGLHKGSLVVRQGDHTFSLGPGRHFFMMPGHGYHLSFSSTEVSWHTWFDLGPEIPGALRFLHRRPESRPLGLHLERAMGLFQGFSGIDFKDPSPIFLDFSRAFLQEVLRQFATPDPAEDPRPRPREVQQVLDWIRQHHGEPVDLADMADEIGVSREHLIRLFHKVLGRTPMECLWSIRIDRARDLLSATGASVASIAEQTGFATQAHFARRFQKATGLSPSAWRARFAGGPDPFPPVPSA